MTKFHLRAEGWNPTWTTDTVNYTLDTAFGAGCAYQSAVPHPFAAAGEQYIKFLGSSSHKYTIPTIGLGPDGAPSITGVRSASRFSMLFQLTAAPTATAVLLTGTMHTDTHVVRLKTDRTVDMLFNGGATTNEVASPPAIALNTDYQLELWAVCRDSSGTLLPKLHMIVRLIDLTTFAETILYENTTQFTTQVDNPWANSPQFSIGDTVTDATLVFYAGNWYKAQENADDPQGVIRMERLDVAGNSAIAGWNGAGGNTSVDETGTGVPSDADTATGSVTLQQLYTLANPSIITGSDTIHHPLLAGRVTYTGVLSKGSAISVTDAASDGTTAYTMGAATPLPLTVYNLIPFGKYYSPSAAAWTLTDCNNLEIGCKITTTSTNPMTGILHNFTAIVVYTKSGEGTPAIKADPILRPPLMMKRPRLMLEPDALAQRRGFFVGLLAQPAVGGAAIPVYLMRGQPHAPQPLADTPSPRPTFVQGLAQPAAVAAPVQTWRRTITPVETEPVPRAARTYAGFLGVLTPPSTKRRHGYIV